LLESRPRKEHRNQSSLELTLLEGNKHLLTQCVAT